MYIDTSTVVAEFLRKYITDPRTSRAYSSQTDFFSGDALETQFELTLANVRYIDSVIIEAVTRERFNEYNYDLGMGVADKKCTVTTSFTPVIGVDNIQMTYHYGGTEWIYPDWPDFDRLSNTSFPRISVTEQDQPEVFQGSSSTQTFAETLINIDIWVNNYDLFDVVSNGITYSLGHQNLLDYLRTQIIDAFKTNFRTYFVHKYHNFRVISKQKTLPEDNESILRSNILISITKVE